MVKESAQKENASTSLEGKGRAAVSHLNIRDARSMLSRIVNDMENSQSVFTVGRRNAPTTLLMSYPRFKPFLSGGYKERLAFVIVENLLGSAPLHIRIPQLEELCRSSKEDLLLLASIEKLPLESSTEEELRKQLSEPRILDRLLKRFEIAATIASAKEEGLYDDAAEDLTSRIAP